MRILMVTEAAKHGVGLHVINLVQRLSHYGHEVHLIYSPVRADEMFINGLAEVRHGYAVPLEMQREPGLQDWQGIKFIRNYLKKHGPFDILHGHSSKGGALLRLAGLGLPGVKVYTPNSLVTQDPSLSALQRVIYGWTEIILDCFTDAFIAVSLEEAAEARRLGIAPQKIEVIPNGIEPPRLSDRRVVREQLQLADDELVIGFVGRFYAQKGPELLIRAMALLVDRFKGRKLTLVMVGDGELRKQLHETARELAIDSRVRWLGEVPGVLQMPAFDILAFPSLYEGMPYVLIEAAFAGLPMVAARVGGTGLLVESGVNGYLVPPGDTGSLARALGELVSDPVKRAKFAAASLQKSQAFTLDYMTGRTLALYTRVTEAVGGPHCPKY